MLSYHLIIFLYSYILCLIVLLLLFVWRFGRIHGRPAAQMRSFRTWQSRGWTVVFLFFFGCPLPLLVSSWSSCPSCSFFCFSFSSSETLALVGTALGTRVSWTPEPPALTCVASARGTVGGHDSLLSSRPLVPTTPFPPCSFLLRTWCQFGFLVPEEPKAAVRTQVRPFLSRCESTELTFFGNNTRFWKWIVAYEHAFQKCRSWGGALSIYMCIYIYIYIFLEFHPSCVFMVRGASIYSL